MKAKTLQQTVTLKASPREVYDMLMDSKKHQSLSGQPAKISRKVAGKFTAWGSHISGFDLALKPGQKIVQAWRAMAGGQITTQSPFTKSQKLAAAAGPSLRRSASHPAATAVTTGVGSRPIGRR
jgi:uncharacterized protein YndB with AHSA1/START domain